MSVTKTEENAKSVTRKQEDNSIMRKKNPWTRFLSHMRRHWALYAMLAPGFIVVLIFNYVPMYGITLAFKSYSPSKGILHSDWVGLDNFKYVFSGYGFFKLVRNTFRLGIMSLIFAFPSSIVMALMINELTALRFKKVVQTISYIPYFISWVVISAMSFSLFNKDYGLINKLLASFGVEPIFWYAKPGAWPWILTIIGIWKGCGWGTIVFLSSMSSINPDLYEAAVIDGAGRWKQTLHVTIPGIMPIICMTFILTLSNIVKDDFEKIYALVGQNTILYETTDVLGTWAYRTMYSSFSNYGDVTAVTTMQGIIGMLLLMIGNWIVKKTGNQSLW